MNERSIRLSTRRQGGLNEGLKTELETSNRLKNTCSDGLQGALHNYPHGARTRPLHELLDFRPQRGVVFLGGQEPVRDFH